MTEVCVNGHTRTEQNTRYHKDNQRNRTKRVCLDCKTAKRERNGKPTAVQLKAQRTTELHEDIEDLLKFGATFEEILKRGGFTTWRRMKESLLRRGRNDLLEQLEAKQEIKSNADLSVGTFNRNMKNVRGSMGLRNRH